MTQSLTLDSMRQALGTALIHSALGGFARAQSLRPRNRPSKWGVERIRRVEYGGAGQPAQTLDVYRPLESEGLLPVVLYVHGGGFSILSKESHFQFGLRFAQAGALVFNIDYRLAPKHPYPAGFEDVCAAWLWVLDNAERYGGDPSRIVLAGESAGGGLITSLALATSASFDNAWATEVFQRDAQPVGVIPACPMSQVSEPERYGARRPLPTWIADRIDVIGKRYLRDAAELSSIDLANPLLWLESNATLARELPPFMIPCGSRDAIRSDSDDLHAALVARGQRSSLHLYAGEPHAFHAFPGRPHTATCWSDMLSFLRTHTTLAQRAA
ncbi:MAG: acetyl esterase [Bradymonadia bacterium]|jgi:acetyl esterase